MLGGAPRNGRGGGFIEMSAQIDSGSHKFGLFAHATPRLVVGACTTGDGAADSCTCRPTRT